MPKRIALVLMALLLAGCGGSGDSNSAPEGPFDYDRDASLEFQDKGRVNRNYPIEIRDVSYASPSGDDAVTAFLVKPPGKGPFPGVVLAHGAGGNRRAARRPGDLAGRARRGGAGRRLPVRP